MRWEELSSVTSLRNGEWYQDLYGWSRILDLSETGNLSLVRLEADGAGHVDDVVAHPREEGMPVEFAQVKFHVAGEAQRYSTTSFIAPPPALRAAQKRGGTSRAKSFLQKFSNSWTSLKGMPGGAKLLLVSNWGWQDGDPLQTLISGINDRFSDELFSAEVGTPVGDARESWRTHLGLDKEEFKAFANCLHFRIGSRSRDDLAEFVAARMRDRALRSDVAAVMLVVAQVNRWIMDGVEGVTPEMYDDALRALDLRVSTLEPAIRVGLHTIERQTFPHAEDYTVDWCEHYRPQNADSPFPRGSALFDTEAPQKTLLPELRRLKQQINGLHVRLLRVRGQSRLTPWFAFGHTFDGRARYVLEVEQNGNVWRTDCTPHRDIAASVSVTKSSFDVGEDLAVAVSITNDARPAAACAIHGLQLPVSLMLAIEPTSGVGRYAIASNQDLVTVIEGVRAAISRAVAECGSRRVHLFYTGPFSGAAFLGHAVGASAQELQLYEFVPGAGYQPTFRLLA